MSRVEEVVDAVARQLVDHPEEVEVTTTERRSGVCVEVRTADGDLGKMIGRQGRTAAAVRTLVSITAELEGSEASVEFVSDD